MTNRPTRLLRAVLTGLVACTSITIIPLSAEGAPGDCLLTKPKTAAPPGQYWLHLSDWITNRHCWVLRAKIETPSQAKGSASVQAARAGARTSATPARSPEDAGSNELPARTDLFPQPRIKDDGKGASAADATAGMSERVDQNISRAEHPDRARLPPVASREVEATGVRFPTSGSQATPAFVAQAQMTDRRASIEAGPAPLSTVAETTTEARTIGAAPNLLQILLLAIFCGPALYLLGAGAIRRLAEPRPRPRPYTSLENASAERALLPPRLEPNENAVAS